MNKSGFWSGAFCALCLSVIVLPVASNLRQKNKTPGFEIYTPNRLEWACVEMQQYGGLFNSIQQLSIKMVFIPEFGGQPDGKSITCILTYSDSIPVSSVNQAKKSVTDLMALLKKRHGWDWLEVQFKELPSPEKP